MCQGLPGGAVVRNPPSDAGDVGSVPGWGAKIPTCHTARTHNEEPRHSKGNPVQPKKKERKKYQIAVRPLSSRTVGQKAMEQNIC